MMGRVGECGGAVSRNGAPRQESVFSRLLQPAFAVALAFSLGGCEMLSRDGPATLAIEGQAATTVSAEPGKPVFDYVLIDIDGSAVSNFGTPVTSSLFTTYGRDKGPAPEIKVGVGDVLQITVFESQSGGLFIPQEAGSRAGNFVTMPPQTVDRRGSISVPYAGQVQAVGRTIPELQRTIENALKNRAIEPQVMLTILSRSSTQASVVGAVNTPSKIEVGPAGERVLDIIAKANGISAPGYETYISVQRGSRKATVFFDTILANAQENIYILPGDIVYAYREPHRYHAFGAVRSPGQVDFGATSVSLVAAVSKVNGLADERANPSDVFLFRQIPRRMLEKANVPLEKFPPQQVEIPVIFRANLRDSASYFAALKFKLANNDILYVSNSGSYELYKFLTLLNNTSDTVANVPSNVLIGRNAARALAR